ncbi:MAG: hypothetical protein K2X82_05005 [Gemmataceae bacterium]|nr:hypothetical protein [Gemmataceae bacterium]
MTARRALALLAGLALGPAPGCLHISGSVTPPPEPSPPPREKFASLPSRPGEVVRANPTAPPPAELPATVSRRPTPPPDREAAPPADPPASAAITAVKADRTEPAQLPLPALNPRPVTADPPLLAAFRAYVENRPEEALRHLDGLDRVNQELALRLLPLLARVGQPTPAAADPAEVGLMADQFQGLADRLGARAPLSVEVLALCGREPRGFGDYHPRPLTDPYRPGDRTFLYLELKHVACDPGPRGEGYLTRVEVTFEVRDSHGRLVEQADPANFQRRVTAVKVPHVQATRSPVRDYFRSYGVAVPPHAGVYTITAEVREPGTGRVARSRPVEFRVAGQ